MAVTLRPVTRDNWRAISALEISDDQRGFVASNVYSLAEAAYEPGLTPVAIYADETLVGFALYTHEPFQGEWTFTTTPYQGELGILRLMVDRQHQRQGYGRQAMREVIARMSNLPGARAIILDFDAANTGARQLYESLGFVVYEEKDSSCWARLTLPDRPQGENQL